jgi:uncharacterized protein (TIGR02145 family)
MNIKNTEDTNSKEVKIGNQVWMLENLDVEKFRNGDLIPQAKTAGEWESAGKNNEPAWCYYDNDESNGNKYGKLYNWHAVNDPRGLAPDGYHIPTNAELTELTDNLGKENLAGVKMKSASGWYESGNGNNSSGFSAQPGGFRYINGSFSDISKVGNWWSSSEADSNNAVSRFLNYYNADVFNYNSDKQNGFSVRCLKD